MDILTKAYPTFDIDCVCVCVLPFVYGQFCSFLLSLIKFSPAGTIRLQFKVFVKQSAGFFSMRTPPREIFVRLMRPIWEGKREREGENFARRISRGIASQRSNGRLI